jgi:hypothetical protein
MNSDRDYLAAQFQLLSDEELLSRGTSGGLTELAQSVAVAEAQARGLFMPELQPTDEDAEAEGSYNGDMQIVERHLTPTEAHLLCSCLQVAGVPAATGDTHFVQANALLAIAVGGACLRVPAQFVPDAVEVIAAFRRGELALGEDVDFDAQA